MRNRGMFFRENSFLPARCPQQGHSGSNPHGIVGKAGRCKKQRRKAYVPDGGRASAS